MDLEHVDNLNLGLSLIIISYRGDKSDNDGNGADDDGHYAYAIYQCFLGLHSQLTCFHIFFVLYLSQSLIRFQSVVEYNVVHHLADANGDTDGWDDGFKDYVDFAVSVEEAGRVVGHS